MTYTLTPWLHLTRRDQRHEYTTRRIVTVRASAVIAVAPLLINGAPQGSVVRCIGDVNEGMHVEEPYEALCAQLGINKPSA